MIKILRVQDFQSHLDTTLNLDPHFNCIIGSGHAGKSSLVRALSLLLYNTWDRSWVRIGASHCTITATLVDGSILTRKKGPKINEYEVTYPDGKTQKFENFGIEVPEEITKLTKVFPVELPGGETIKLNMRSQFDPLFLQSVSPSSRAKLFGKLSGLDILDQVHQGLNLDKNKAQATVRSKEDELEANSSRIANLTSLPQDRIVLEQIREQLVLVQEQVAKLEELRSLQSQIGIWKLKYGTLSTQILKYQGLDDLSTEKIEQKVQALLQYRDLQHKIQQWKAQHAWIQQQVQTTEAQLSQVKQTYADQLHIAGVCPTCRTSITDDCLEKVVEDL